MAPRARASPTIALAPFVPPYPPSWPDRFAGWVERLPGPPFVLYLALIVLIFATETVIHWQAGVLPVGSWRPSHVAMALASPYALAVGHYLKRTAASAFSGFGPALRAAPQEAQRLQYEFTVLPPMGAWLASLLGLVFGLTGSYFLSDRFFDFLQLARTPTSIAFNGVIGPITWVTFAVLLYRIVRTLVMVRHLFAQWTHVDLLHIQPLFALSGLTARAAVAVLILPAIFVSAAPDIAEQDVSATLGLGYVVLGLATFGLPLTGIHRLLSSEKDLMRTEQAGRMRKTIDDLHARVDKGRLQGMDELNKAMASLEIEHAALARVPTWPWEPATLRGFIVALVIPIVIWLAQYSLSRWLGA